MRLNINYDQFSDYMCYSGIAAVLFIFMIIFLILFAIIEYTSK